jgi:hypothetical protein
MPPKADPAKEVKPEEKKGPPPKPKSYLNEAAFVAAAKKQMEQLLEKLAPAPTKDAKNAKVESEPASEVLLNKDQCRQYVEACNETWYEEKELEEIWQSIPKAKDKEGKELESATVDGLRDFTLNRHFEKKLIEKTRYDEALETAP